MLELQELTIASGASLSSAVSLSGVSAVAIVMPAAWTTANITLQGDATGNGDWLNVYDDIGTERVITAAASRFITLDPAALVAFHHIRLRSGTSGTPVTQAADRTLKIVGRKIA